jgi:hypothetical protein
MSAAGEAADNALLEALQECIVINGLETKIACATYKARVP